MDVQVAASGRSALESLNILPMHGIWMEQCHSRRRIFSGPSLAADGNNRKEEGAAGALSDQRNPHRSIGKQDCCCCPSTGVGGAATRRLSADNNFLLLLFGQRRPQVNLLARWISYNWSRFFESIGWLDATPQSHPLPLWALITDCSLLFRINTSVPPPYLRPAPWAIPLDVRTPKKIHLWGRRPKWRPHPHDVHRWHRRDGR